MDPFVLTRQLIDIESITGNEGHVGGFLHGQLESWGFHADKIEAAPGRYNVYATWPDTPSPTVVLSTHMDTVPPFISSSEDDTRIYGRGSCDAKGIIAAQTAAALHLREEGVHVGLLFVVGEERDSTGAIVANKQPRGSRFLINGEPTENKLGVASKGALRVELTATGRMAHSAYPELGESAIEKLLDALRHLREMPLPQNPEVGPCTMNIGVIQGGRAPNVIPDHAGAQLLFRLVGPSDELRRQITGSVSPLVHVNFSLEIPFVKLQTVPGIPTMAASFTTDIPALSNWGKPLLIGPGSIHVAHTEHEFIEKKQLVEAIQLYSRIARHLSTS